MRKLRGVRDRLFVAAWVVGMGCITGILLSDQDGARGVDRYLKLYGVGVLWLVFLVFVWGQNRVSELVVIPKHLDRLVLFLVLCMVFVVLVVETLRLALSVKVFSALLLGVICLAVSKVILDLLRAKEA